MIYLCLKFQKLTKMGIILLNQRSFSFKISIKQKGRGGILKEEQNIQETTTTIRNLCLTTQFAERERQILFDDKNVF